MKWEKGKETEITESGDECTYKGRGGTQKERTFKCEIYGNTTVYFLLVLLYSFVITYPPFVHHTPTTVPSFIPSLSSCLS